MTHAPASSMADSLVIPPKRPLGLIAIVLVIDLGLAAAGAVMLGKGLSKGNKAPSEPPRAQPAPQLGAPAPNVTPNPVRRGTTP